MLNFFRNLFYNEDDHNIDSKELLKEITVMEDGKLRKRKPSKEEIIDRLKNIS